MLAEGSGGIGLFTGSADTNSSTYETGARSQTPTLSSELRGQAQTTGLEPP
jgi:hypothetical protein